MADSIKYEVNPNNLNKYRFGFQVTVEEIGREFRILIDIREQEEKFSDKIEGLLSVKDDSGKIARCRIQGNQDLGVVRYEFWITPEHAKNVGFAFVNWAPLNMPSFDLYDFDVMAFVKDASFRQKENN